MFKAMRGHVLKIILVLWCTANIEVCGYSRGAPDTTCENMTPGHGLTKQDGPSPYTITPSSSSVESGKRMLVTLEAPDDNPGFEGFLVQARRSGSDEIVGTFFTTDHSYITCGKGFNNAVTHSSPTKKPKVSLQWEAPSDFEGDVVFMSSFVQSYDTYWVGVTSEKVTVTKGAEPQTPATTAAATTTTTTTTTPESSGSVSSSVDVFSPENAGDSVINIVDAPGVVEVPVVENDIGVVNDEDAANVLTPTLVSSPSSPTSPSLSSSTGSSSSPITEDITGSTSSDSGSSSISTRVDVESQGVTRSPNEATTRRRLSLLGNRFRTSTSSTTQVTSTTTTPAPTSSEPPAPSVPSEDLAPGIASLQNAMQNIYLGCQTNKGCFGFPSGCEEKEDCNMLMTYTKVSSGYQFEITGTAGSSGYVAGGLSLDNTMGTDSVMACTALDGEVDVLMTFNEGKTNEILSNSKYGITDIKTTQVDGKVYCSFIRQTVTEIKSIKFDLAEDRFNLMLARGPAAQNQLRYHDKRLISSGTSSLEDFELKEAKSELFKTLHACFMIAAWVAAASCGIILARYFKQTWLQSQCCGIDQWFHFHRFFMILTWSLTMAGSGFIVYYVGGWSDIPLSTNPHPLLGAISTGLCFIQPFMALFRCGPTHKKRPIFNWLHWFVGNSAQILGLTAIFYGLNILKKPTWSWFVLIVFIAFHCIVHLILSVGQCVSDSKANRLNNVFPMKELNGSRNPLHPVDKRTDAPGGTFRKAMLAIYLIVTWLIAAVLIVIVIFREEQLREWGILFWEK